MIQDLFSYINETYGAWHLVHLIKAVIIVLFSAGVGFLLGRFFLPLLRRIINRTPTKLDKRLEEHYFFLRILWLIPGVIAYNLAGFWLSEAPVYFSVLITTSNLWLMIVGILSFYAFLDALLDIYNTFPFARQMPVRGLVQVIKLITLLAVLVIMVALFLDKSPALLFSGMGAMTAVLLLVFREPILGFVAGIQLSANRMLALGDWLEMPKYQADGDVVEITLTTVKVRNWDRTITTIPTYALITDSFRNWRGMLEAGGRRIKRSISIDFTSIHFLDESEIERLQQLQLITDYIKEKVTEIEQHNRDYDIDPTSLANGRHLTNIGTFRAYLINYLRNHSSIRSDMMIMVRQLQPTEQGLPMEVYVFTNDTRWTAYEAIQADIFDHICAVIPEFGLRIFQAPSSSDVKYLASAGFSKKD